MGMTAKEIESRIMAAIPDAAVQLTDLAGDNDHYSVIVTSPIFAGKTRVAQHKLVFEAIGSGMGTQLHALSVTTKVPA